MQRPCGGTEAAQLEELKACGADAEQREASGEALEGGTSGGRGAEICLGFGSSLWWLRGGQGVSDTLREADWEEQGDLGQKPEHVCLSVSLSL